MSFRIRIRTLICGSVRVRSVG